MNLPNQITVARLFISLIFLGLLGYFDVRQLDGQRWMLDLAFWLFIVAAVSDILDGYLARRQNQVTTFGRILDPFVDKILVCGGFVLLLGRGFVDQQGAATTGLSAWMVLVIIARELLVSGLRGFSESQGKPYAANYWGKVKMVVQCVTMPLILKTVGDWRDIAWIITCRDMMIGATVVVTALSVLSYLAASRDELAQRIRE